MSWATVLVARLRGLFAQERVECELADEIRFHLEMQVEENIKAGMSPAAAQYEAMRSFGAVESVKERYRERSKFAFVAATVQDIRYAARVLRKSPAFATTAGTVLALGIAVVAAMFSVLDGVLLRPLPFRSPEHLAMLWTEDPTRDFRQGRSALWNVEQWRNQSRSFDDLATFDAKATVLAGADGPEPIVGAAVSANLFSLLGVRPVLGRTFNNAGREGHQRSVLISHRMWLSRFGGSTSALGETLVLDGLPCRIIGVLPAGFNIARLDADVWQPQDASPVAGGAEEWFVIGRLKPETTLQQARADLTAVAHRLKTYAPRDAQNRIVAVEPLESYVVGSQWRWGLWIVGGAVLCVFLIAAANLMSLSLARGVVRTREMAIRAALGATAPRLLRQLLVESLLVAVAAGVTGLLLAAVLIELIRTWGPDNLPRLNEVRFDLRVTLQALGTAVLSGLIMGASTASAAMRRPLRTSGAEGGRSVSGGVAIRRTRGALVVGDFALAIILLAAAGLLIRSWWNVTSVDAGFRSERVLAMEVSAPGGFGIPAQQNFYEQLLRSLQAIPGVEAAGIIGEMFKDYSREGVITVESQNGTTSARLQFTGEEVGGDFFKTVGTPLLRGRFFSPADTPYAAPVAIVNHSMARRCWPGSDPLGRRFKLGPPDGQQTWYTVVGIVGDIRIQGPERSPLPQMFVSLAQSAPPRNVDVFIRTSSANPQAMAETFRAAVRNADKSAVVAEVTTLKQQFGKYLGQRRFQTSLLTGFSVVALLIAAVGIYGCLQYSTATRTGEIGVRMALGAQPSEIFRMILKEGLALSLLGVVLGLSGTLLLGRAGSVLLFGVAPTDPTTLALVSALLIAIGVVACYLPARRAMRIEPMMVLRQEN